jgi:hypothetical protein
MWFLLQVIGLDIVSGIDLGTFLPKQVGLGIYLCIALFLPKAKQIISFDITLYFDVVLILF